MRHVGLAQREVIMKFNETPLFTPRPDKKIHTACPNSVMPVHVMGCGSPPTPIPAAWKADEFAAAVKSPSVIKHAKNFARGCGRDPQDLLSSALIHALTMSPHPACSLPAALVAIMKSKASSIRRSRERKIAAGRTDVPLELVEGALSIDEVNGRSASPYDELVSRDRSLRIEAALKEIIGADVLVGRLVEAMADGLRGHALSDRLGLDKKQLATLRKHIKRRGQKVLASACVGGRLDVDRLPLPPTQPA
jgi:hypothetical protein